MTEASVEVGVVGNCPVVAKANYVEIDTGAGEGWDGTPEEARRLADLLRDAAAEAEGLRGG